MQDAGTHRDFLLLLYSHLFAILLRTLVSMEFVFGRTATAHLPRNSEISLDSAILVSKFLIVLRIR